MNLDKFHCGYTISETSGISRVTSGESKIGDPVLISYNDLYFNTEKHCQYLVKDHLSFWFITAELVSEHEVLPIQITMINFEEHKIYNKEWYSSPFYTYPQGYKMCLRVDANGYGIGKGTHISVFVHLMRREFDDKLDWPFQGRVTVTVLNHLDNKGHILNTFDFTHNIAISYCSRVTSMERNPKGWGFHAFLAHDKLKYNPEVYCQYLQYDCLCFRVQFEMLR